MSIDINPGHMGLAGTSFASERQHGKTRKRSGPGGPTKRNSRGRALKRTKGEIACEQEGKTHQKRTLNFGVPNRGNSK